MTFSVSFIAIVIHAVLTLLLSFIIPLLEPFSWRDTGRSALLFFAVLTVGNIFIACRSRIQKKKYDAFQYLDLSVFLSIWTGVNQLAFKTQYPAPSPRYYPEISNFFPAFFIIGLGIIVFTSLNRQLKLPHKAWLVGFIVTSFPYTHPLDHYVLAMCFPLMLLLYAVHRNTKAISEFFQKPFYRSFFLLAFAFFLFQLFISLRNDFDQAVPDILLFATMLFTFPLIWGAIKTDKKSTFLVVKIAFAGQAVLLICLAVIWYAWTASNWGALSILKFRLWISLIHPNALAACLAASFLVLEPWKKWGIKHAFTVFISSLVLIMLLLTQSRGVVFSLLLSLIIVNFNLLHLIRKPQTKQLIGFLSAVAATVILGAVIYQKVHYRLIAVQAIQDRIALWKAAWTGIKSHLWSGFGFGSKQYLAQFVTDPFSANIEFLRSWMGWNRLGRHFHNLFIEILWLFGLPGLVVFMMLFYGCFFRKRYSKSYSGVIAAAMTLALSGFFDCTIYYSAIMYTSISLFGVLSGLSFEQKDADAFHKILPKRSLALPAVLAVTVLFLVVIPVFHQRFLFAWGIHQLSIDSDKSKALLKTAALYKPPSGKVTEKLVGLMIDNGECIDAVAFTDAYMSKTKIPTNRLMRLHAWLEHNENLRLDRLLRAWHIDPSGLISENLSFEVFLAKVQSESFEIDHDVVDYLLADRNFYRLLRDHASTNIEGLSIGSKEIRSMLQARGLNLSLCNVKYNQVDLSLEEMLSKIETELAQCNDTVMQCNKKRQAYFLSMLDARDIVRATRAANSWYFELSETQLVGNIHTFRDGSSAYAVIQAHKALGRGDYLLAEQFLVSASAEEMSNPAWFYLMSIVLGEKEAWSESLEKINTALRYAPHEPRFLIVKGTALYHLGQHHQALLAFHGVLKVFPWSVKALSYTGIIHYELEEYEEAAKYFEIAKDLTPKDPQAYFNLFMALTALPDRKDDAKKLRETIVQRFDEVAIPEDLKERIFNEDNGKR